ncbi:MAG: sensor histidine kinase [Solirubrobacteraceae bacterium]
MPPGPTGRALGLRARIVGVVMVTAVATLAIAAVTLLGPLEHSLRNAERVTLSKSLGNRTMRTFEAMRLDRLATDPSVLRSLRKDVDNLQQRTAATVLVFAGAGPDGTGSHSLLPVDEDDAGAGVDVAKAFRTGAKVSSFVQVGGEEYAREAIAFTGSDRLRYVLAVRKSIGEVPDAAHAVARAFLYAALAGLALSLILGIPLSARLVRRLRRLREAALQVTDTGAAVEVPVDRSHDEVGDLSRALSTMQHRLGRQEQARREFVSTASHELRTPLASLEGMLELLRDDLHDDHPDLEDARALVERAHAQARRLGRLASDLLDLSRIDAQVQLRSEPVELSELSRAVLAEFGPGTERHEIVSNLRETNGSVWALGDPGAVAQILRILLDNAVRASAPGSEITVALGREPAAALSVSDQGPGVPEDEREAIFERFHRGRDTAGKAGFGLGLPIGRELAKRMGGELVLEDRPGPGATFTLRLPAAPAPEPDPVAVA